MGQKQRISRTRSDADREAAKAEILARIPKHEEIGLLPPEDEALFLKAHRELKEERDAASNRAGSGT
jgi:hypothetical protein